MQFDGSCHCGNIRFQAEGEIKGVMACNCSICQRKGSPMWFAPASSFKMLTSRDAIRTYTFNKHVIQHHFCPNCGMHPFGEEGTDPKGNSIVAVNVRCLEGIDLESIPVQHFDGRSK
jgi:hypothetical protein